MEVKIVSREVVKPCSLTISNKKTHKLSLFDQLTPITYMSIVLFYPNISLSDPNYDISKTLTQLKKSLSETLNLYYPFSGRTKNNLFVEDFDAGVLFLEAEVDIRMSEYFKLKDIESLNKLVPFKPLRKEAGSDDIPLLAFQANVFSCGTVAIGTSFCHKIADGATMSYLLSTWAALSRGKPDQVINPSFSTAAALFPPVEGLPERSVVEKIWFQKEGNYITRRFVFDAESMEALIEKARSEGATRPPTRNEAVSCFLMKHATEASRAVSGDRMTIPASIHAVNLRPRMTWRSPDWPLDGAAGNFIWFAVALSFDPSDERSSADVVELRECTAQLRRAMEGFSEFFGAVTEEEAGSSEVMSNLEDMLDMESELKADTLMFTNWKSFYNEVDFGWGKPVWVGPAGKPGPVLRDYVTMIESVQFPKGIEAFVSMEDNKMAVLEKDEEFLKFASPNPDFERLII